MSIDSPRHHFSDRLFASDAPFPARVTLQVPGLPLGARFQIDAVAEADWLWYNLATPPRLGLAAPVKTLLKRAAAELNAGETS